MELKEDAFIFDSYSVLPSKKEIDFNYKYKGLGFIEKIILPDRIPANVEDKLVNKVLESLHLVLGISYFKMYCPKKITIPYHLSKAQADFWNTVYTKGLGEFFYKNKIDFRGLINFPYLNNKPAVQPRRPACRQAGWDEAKKNRYLVGIGGGKDSIVAIELLKKEGKHVTGLILETGPSHIQREVAKTAGIEFILVKRILDDKLFELKDIYNGHVPFSAIFAFTALLVSVIYDYSSIITANEKSSNFGNLNYLGTGINHQWSKSQEFENLFEDYVKKFITPDVDFFSILRPYSEMEIVKLFSSHKKYFSVFSSCNRNFKIKGNVNQKRWCGECAKCAFVFIMLAAQLPKKQVISIFDKNMLDDESLIPLYRDLIGEGLMKPFDCVGTFAESRQALAIIKNKKEFDVSKII
ncbi:hypothetical protein HZA75_05100 [Candidatus Roizmanbacteria bacterium]|nr:hypothetical protein [Candidatus Roizmanbacteria bacterium]